MTASAAGLRRPAPGTHPGRAGASAAAGAARPPHPAPGHGHRPLRNRRPEPKRSALPSWHRGCRAPARRVLGRRVRYHIGAEPGQVNGRRWPAGSAR
ncbi:tryptophan biosynthesis modulator TrpM [Streptomyces celluloflavus]|uniref:tryptophan biosynthesis modulator TrpM n=1 Tax=Streptomyces celluloflavus TaxID=58344 RepID=UPI00368B7EE0